MNSTKKIVSVTAGLALLTILLVFLYAPFGHAVVNFMSQYIGHGHFLSHVLREGNPGASRAGANAQ